VRSQAPVATSSAPDGHETPPPVTKLSGDLMRPSGARRRAQRHFATSRNRLPRDWIFVAFTFSPVVLFLITVFAMWIGEAQPEDFPAWLEALATATALVAAAAAAVFAWRAYQLESGREQQRLQMQLMAQASLVAAWYGTKDLPRWISTGPQDQGYFEPTPYPGIVLRNASDLPVLDASVDIVLVGWDSRGSWIEEPIGSQRIGLIPPSSEPRYAHMDAVLNGIREHRALQWVNHNGSSPDYELQLKFRDAAGHLDSSTRRRADSRWQGQGLLGSVGSVAIEIRSGAPGAT